MDLYIRLHIPYPYVEKEFRKFSNRLDRIHISYNAAEVERLTEIINQKEEWTTRRQDALNALWNIF